MREVTFERQWERRLSPTQVEVYKKGQSYTVPVAVAREAEAAGAIPAEGDGGEPGSRDDAAVEDEKAQG